MLNGNHIPYLDNIIKEPLIDFGTGSNQTYAVHLPVLDAAGHFTATNVEEVLAEIQTSVDLVTTSFLRRDGTLPMTGNLLLGSNGIGNDDSVLTFASGSTGLATFAGSVSVGIDLTVLGNLTVSGTEFIANVETVEVEDNTILLNSGETGSGVTAGVAGLYIDRGTSTTAGILWQESDDTIRVGLEGSYQAVATREDTPTDNGIAFWDAATYKFETSSDLIWDGTNLDLGTSKFLRFSTNGMTLNHNGSNGFITTNTGNLYLTEANTIFFQPDYFVYLDVNNGFVVRDNTDSNAEVFNLAAHDRTLAIGGVSDTIATTHYGNIKLPDNYKVVFGTDIDSYIYYSGALLAIYGGTTPISIDTTSYMTSNVASFYLDINDYFRVRDADNTDAILFNLNANAHTLDIGNTDDAIETTHYGDIIIPNSYGIQINESELLDVPKVLEFNDYKLIGGIGKKGVVQWGTAVNPDLTTNVTVTGNISVNKEWQGRKNIVQMYNDADGTVESLIKTFSEQITDTIEFVIGRDISTSGEDMYISLLDGATRGPFLRLQSNNIQFYDGATYTTIGTYNNDTPLYFTIKWDCLTDTFEAWVNGIQLENSGTTTFDFWDAVTAIDTFRVYLEDVAATPWYGYVDNIGLESEDYTPRALLWTPTVAGTVTAYVYEENGRRWNRINDNDAVNAGQLLSSFTEQATGTIKVNLRTSDASPLNYFTIGDGSDSHAIYIAIVNDQFEYYVSSWNILTTVADDEILECIIRWDCSDTWSVEINGVLYSGLSFRGTPTALDHIKQWTHTTGQCVWDAELIYTSWESQLKGANEYNLHLVNPQQLDVENLSVNNIDALYNVNLRSGAVINSADEDLTHTFGRAAIGSPAADIAYFAHRDMLTVNNYGFRQDANGNSFTNAPTGQKTYFSINNSTIADISSTGLTMANGKNIYLPDSTYLYVGSGNDLQLYHNGSNSYIESNTNNLIIKADNAGSNTAIYFTTDAAAPGSVLASYMRYFEIYDRNDSNVTIFKVDTEGRTFTIGNVNDTVGTTFYGNIESILGATDEHQIKFDYSAGTYTGDIGFYANTSTNRFGFYDWTTDGGDSIWYYDRDDTTKIVFDVDISLSTGNTIYFANGTTYYVDGSGNAVFNAGTFSNNITLTGGNRYINATAGYLALTSTTNMYFQVDSDQATNPSSGVFYWRDGANSDVMTLDESGNLAASGTIIANNTIQSASGNSLYLKTDGHMFFDIDSDNNQTDRYWRWRDNGITTRMLLTDDGLLGVGITPVSQLHVYQNDTATGIDCGITVEQDGTGDAQVQYLLTGDYRWVTGIDNDDTNKFKIGTGSNWSNYTNVEFDVSGNTQFNGAVTLSSATATILYMANGTRTWQFIGDNSPDFFGLHDGSNYAFKIFDAAGNFEIYRNINLSNSAPSITFTDTDVTRTAVFQFDSTTADTPFTFSTANAWQFLVDSSPRLTIDGNGLVIFGDVGGSYKVDTSGVATFNTVYFAGGTTYYVNSSGNANFGSITGSGNIYTSNGVFNGSATNHYIQVNGSTVINVGTTTSVCYTDWDCYSHKARDMGSSGLAWDECYADNWNNVGPAFIKQSNEQVYKDIESLDLITTSDEDGINARKSDGRLEMSLKSLPHYARDDVRHSRQYRRKVIKPMIEKMKECGWKPKTYIQAKKFIQSFEKKEDMPLELQNLWREDPYKQSEQDKGVSLGQWIYTLHKAFKHAQVEIASLKQENLTLEERIKKIEDMLYSSE